MAETLLSYTECTATDGSCINTAQADRAVLDSIWCCQGVIDRSEVCSPGLAGTGELLVTAPAGGSSYSVTVADGRAVIQGQSQPYQGMYHVIHTATEEITGGCPAPTTGSRIDAVVLVVNDNTLDDSGLCGAELRLLCNTAQLAGSSTPAPMTDAEIKAAIGDSYIRLADVTIVTGQTHYTAVADTRPYARTCAEDACTCHDLTSTVNDNTQWDVISLKAQQSGCMVYLYGDVRRIGGAFTADGDANFADQTIFNGLPAEYQPAAGQSINLLLQTPTGDRILFGRLAGGAAAATMANFPSQTIPDNTRFVFSASYAQGC